MEANAEHIGAPSCREEDLPGYDESTTAANADTAWEMLNLPSCSLPLIPVKGFLPSNPSAASLKLSDSTSVVSAEEVGQRREALLLFSSQQSMASSTGRSGFISNMAINEPTPFSSTLSSLSPLCRICQCTAESDNILVTPCRCDGSLKHIHATCLLKWIDVSAKRHRKLRTSSAAFCELCGYIYRRHKYVKYREWKWPKIALRERVLHSVFAVTLIIMLGCAVATVLCFITDNGQYKRGEDRNLPLTQEEIITICCGITFFVSFFISMSAEIKAKKTLYQIYRKCVRHNTVWFVENYNIAHDPEYKRRLLHNRLAVTQAEPSKPSVDYAEVEVEVLPPQS